MGSEFQTMNGQNKLALWAERVSACRSSDLSVRDWCKENDICEQTYYRWQRKLYGIVKAQQEQSRFAGSGTGAAALLFDKARADFRPDPDGRARRREAEPENPDDAL